MIKENEGMKLNWGLKAESYLENLLPILFIVISRDEYLWAFEGRVSHKQLLQACSSWHTFRAGKAAVESRGFNGQNRDVAHRKCLNQLWHFLCKMSHLIQYNQGYCNSLNGVCIHTSQELWNWDQCHWRQDKEKKLFLERSAALHCWEIRLGNWCTKVLQTVYGKFLYT